MRNKFGIGSVFVLGVLIVLAVGKAPGVQAQRAKPVQQSWEYKVSVFSYNPGEKLSDDQRAARYEKLLNAEAREGWEPVTSLLTRNTVQTIGGGVTTRDSTSFVAFRRPR